MRGPDTTEAHNRSSAQRRTRPTQALFMWRVLSVTFFHVAPPQRRAFSCGASSRFWTALQRAKVTAGTSAPQAGTTPRSSSASSRSQTWGRGCHGSGRWARGPEWLTCPAAGPGDRGTRLSHDGLQQGAFCDGPACASVSDRAAPGCRTCFGNPLGDSPLDTPRDLYIVHLQPPGPSSARCSRATPERRGPAVAQPRAQPLKAPTTYL